MGSLVQRARSEYIDHMTALEAVRKELHDHMPELRSRFGVVSLGVFGSYARAEHDATSDIDILAEFAPDARVGFFEFLTLQEHLASILGRPVDLVTRTALKPSMGDRILDELVPI